MRMLEKEKIPYQVHDYSKTGAVNGIQVAKVLDEAVDQVFKTLVLVGKSRQHYVFVIPVATELNLKEAAKQADEKSLEMLPQKSLLPLTGYVHGGCSPIGMKKLFKTFLSDTMQSFDTIMVSAGKVGYQLELAPDDLAKMIQGEWVDTAIVTHSIL